MRVAEVVSVAPHPKADRLRVCQVDAGGVSTVKVVTNAQNVEEGMKVVFAVSGPAAAAGRGAALRERDEGQEAELDCQQLERSSAAARLVAPAGAAGAVAHCDRPCSPGFSLAATPGPQPVGCTTRNGVTIEQAALRGVDSFGMLCSAHECGWVSEPGATGRQAPAGWLAGWLRSWVAGGDAGGASLVGSGAG